MTEQLTTSASLFVVAGARSFSLGAALAEELAAALPSSIILIIDVDPTTSSRSNVIARQLDLNPLHHPGGFEVWSTELNGQLRGVAESTATRAPVQGVFLGVAQYHVGNYESSNMTDRADLLGSNVLGKFEVLHAVMRLNADLGFDNATALDVFDVGALHCLRRTSHRALYNSTKAASLTLCQVLIAGSEVRRAVHVAPGCIDTPMLHWNHWFLKEKGDPKFPELVRHRLPSLYGPIFRDGDSKAFATAILELELDCLGIQAVFERYVRRREAVLATEEGITSPESLAAYLASLMLERGTIDSGVIEATSPRGRLKVLRRPF